MKQVTHPLEFHAGQWRAWNSEKRIVAIIAGTRSGKTSFGPLWLFREMQRKGPGDYLVAAPTLTLIDRAAGPELKSLFERELGLGKMYAHPWKFQFTKKGHQSIWGREEERPCRIIFGHGEDPDSMEALTARACWLDEAGQKKFKFGSWDAANRRVHIDRGRILITTTPYTLGWLKSEVHDKAGVNSDIDLIRFESIDNPAFPREEWERAQRELPRWKFDLFYRGIFTRPPGMIYDCFEEKMHVTKWFEIPPHWPRWVGLDFGGVHTAGVFLAEEMGVHNERTGRLFVYRVYGPAGNATAKQHVAELLKGERGLPTAVGGSKSEDQWRDEFASAGLAVNEPPVSEVEVGIDRVYGTIKRNELVVVLPDARNETRTNYLLDELRSYSRVLDDMGEPTRDIDEKSSYHVLDALRYVVSYLKGGGFGWDSGQSSSDYRGDMARAPKGMFLEDFPLR